MNKISRPSSDGKLDKIISRLAAQQPELPDADELTDRIMQSLPEQPAKQKPLLRRWAVAASIAIIFCIGAAAAGVWMTFSEKAEGPEIPEKSEVSEVSESSEPSEKSEAPAPAFFVFDNEEMQEVAAVIAKHYRLTPVFENEEVKKMRIYLKIDKSKTIQEVVEQLNELDEFTASVSDGKLIIK